MSEKKSNGQVPEEGPDGKNLEQSEEKESFAFLEETIKPKKISRQQGIETAHPDCNMRTGFRRLCMLGYFLHCARLHSIYFLKRHKL